MARSGRCGGRWVSAVLVGLVVAWSACAHETDQFLMPPPEEGPFADLGPYFNDLFVDAIRDGVARTNGQIDRELASASPDAEELARLRSPAVISRRVRRSLPVAMELIEGLERRLPTERFRAQYDGRITIYKRHFEDGMHTDLHPIYDIRWLGRLWRSGTVKVYGTYLGTDKLGHFLDMGYLYHQRYRWAVDRGVDPDEAMAIAVYIGTRDPLISERALLGRFTSGAYSNADLASNYLGCLFYRNLTEPMLLNGRWCEPSLRLDDQGRWELAPQTESDPQFFSRYISDHLNEALNPSLFKGEMRRRARRAVAGRWEHLVNNWYTDEAGDPRSPAWFTEKVLELATYHGMDYGHSRRFNKLVHLGNTAPEDADR